jgi:hypothetical protein
MFLRTTDHMRYPVTIGVALLGMAVSAAVHGQGGGERAMARGIFLRAFGEDR